MSESACTTGVRECNDVLDHQAEDPMQILWYIGLAVLVAAVLVAAAVAAERWAGRRRSG